MRKLKKNFPNIPRMINKTPKSTKIPQRKPIIWGDSGSPPKQTEQASDILGVNTKAQIKYLLIGFMLILDFLGKNDAVSDKPHRHDKGAQHGQ